MVVKFRKENAGAFAVSNDPWIAFKRYPQNEYDRNTTRIIGCSKGFIGTKRRFIGYVPKEMSRAIVEGRFWKGLRKIRQKKLLSKIGNQPLF